MKKQTIGFIGLGLIGGSIARCIKAKAPEHSIYVYNARHPYVKEGLKLALEEHTIDKIVSDLSDFSACDIIFLCAPVMVNVSYLEKLKPIIKPDCILTDVGSVKKDIHDAVKQLDLESQFVGGHPMAGSEKIGYEYSSLDMLKDAYYLITPTEKTPESMVHTLIEIAQYCDCRTMILDASQHDDATAAISHVPHVIAANLVNMVAKHDNLEQHMRHLMAGGFKSTTRIASSSPEMWQNICLTNTESILKYLDSYQESLAEFKEVLKMKDEEKIMEFFSHAKEYRDSVL
ncbi:MAG: prephenate dehydrogenase/arogenate dehydrogenase family protein [Lachnospiraceae bacterium]|nr:prephenate dehydrogenase/arogenate dehydrogenase family protein [Lachnospiraceae bacterium]